MAIEILIVPTACLLFTTAQMTQHLKSKDFTYNTHFAYILIWKQ